MMFIFSIREETILLQVEDSSTSKNDILNILFWCHICGKCFRRKIDLNKHFAFVHFGDKKFECTECNLRYKDEDSYLRHKKRRHEPKLQIESVLCHSCGAVFKSDRALEKHALNSHSDEVEGNEPLQCDLCEKSFEDRAALRIHLREHPDDRVRKCQVCEEVFFSLHKYRYHVKIKHELDTYYFCQVCKKLFPSATRLKVHEKTHDEDHERIETECPICQKWVKYLKSHMDNVHSTEMSAVCEVCGRGFKKGWDFKKHLEKHSEEEKFNCSKCEIVLSSDAKLKKHEKTHAKLMCSKCGKRFFKEATFEKHLKQHLGNTYETILKLFTGTENTHLSDTNGIFRCGDCILDFPFKPNLVKHIRKKHPGKSYFKCKGCRRDFDEEVYFFSRAHLSFHMEQVHENEEKKCETNNPVTCFICDRELKSLEGLKSHLIYHHISQHLMICYICNKTCKSAMHLKNHIWKEHCEKILYLCGTCGQSCSSKGCLNDHIVEDHYINRKIKCKLCRPLDIHTMFVDEIFLRGHLIASHSPQQVSKISKECLPRSTEFVCGECGQVMESLARIKLHIYLDHYTPWSKHLSCEYCKHHIRWYFVSTKALEKHISNDHPQLVNRNEDNGLRVDLALADEVVPLSERDVEGVASFDDVHDGEEEVLILTIEDTGEESGNEEDAIVDEDFTMEDLRDCKEDSVDSVEKLSDDHVKIEWIVDNNFEKNLRSGFAGVEDENTESDNLSL